MDLFAGQVKRAPRGLRRAGLEWILRLLQEPRRPFRPYVGDLLHSGGVCLAQCREMPCRPRDAPS